MAVTSPMSNAGSESASRGYGAWPVECRVGGKSGNTPDGGGSGAVSRSGVWVGPVCESSAVFLRHGGEGFGARDSSLHLLPELPPLAHNNFCNSVNATTLALCSRCDMWCDVGCGRGHGGGGSAHRLGWPGERQEEVECARGRGAVAVGGGVRRQVELSGEGRRTRWRQW